MPEPIDPNETADLSAPSDSLDAGLAAGFRRLLDAPGSVLSRLRSTLGPLRPVVLREADGESSLLVKPRTDAMPTAEQAGDRYQLSGEIARGGMGAILRGRDVDLGRDLAVKVLLERYSNRPEVARRFIEEAQIGGQLQHPGVVPVYDIGRFGDRPYFTMKLVKGETLAAILSHRADPSSERPRLLAIALQVSQTLAYAHAKGVIHRDLKPANIMVGAFGEVQVMDWGLAKVLASGGIADEELASRGHQPSENETTIRTARSGGTSFGTETEAGSMLGTPAYMPPEQANGDIAILDRRADVFGLGAILCEILTGKPPYVGRSGEEVRRKAANGDLADAISRLDACGADAELVTLTRSCLAPEPGDRPRDAQEAVFRDLVARQPSSARHLGCYGIHLQERGRTADAGTLLDRAIAEWRRTITLDPKSAMAHSSLGNALSKKGQIDEAIACYRKAVELDPKNAYAPANLANAEQMTAGREKFADFQAGRYVPTTTRERIDLACWCRFKKLNRTAAGLYASAFADDPKLAADLKAAHRYNAASQAALASAGQGEDSASLDESERTRLRKQALDWLLADLMLRTQQLATGKPADRAEVLAMMKHWQKDADLAGIRDEAALAKLPPEEREAFVKLWADVAALLQ